MDLQPLTSNKRHANMKEEIKLVSFNELKVGDVVTLHRTPGLRDKKEDTVSIEYRKYTTWCFYEKPTKVTILNKRNTYNIDYETDKNIRKQLTNFGTVTAKRSKAGQGNCRIDMIPKEEQVWEVHENVFERKVMPLDVLTALPKRTYETLTVGADPEVFIQKKGTAQIIPAFKIFPSKEEAKKSKEVGYWDGFQAEFNTDAISCIAYHTDSLHQKLNALRRKLQQTGDKGYVLSKKTVINLTSPMRKDAEPEHLEFGCMPSFNAYGENRVLPDGDTVPFRMAGGHLHFGWDELIMPDDETKVRMVKAMDAILGVAAVSLFAEYDDPRRRELYGRAGEYRTPVHGLEYRVLSNAWLIHPVFAQCVFELGRKALYIGEHDLLNKIWNASEEETRAAINNTDVALAREILTKNLHVLRALMEPLVGNHKVDTLMKTIMEGFHSVTNSKRSVFGNWKCLPTQRWEAHANAANCSLGKGLTSIQNGEKI